MLTSFFQNLQQRFSSRQRQQQEKRQTLQEKLRTLEAELNAMQTAGIFRLPNPMGIYQKKKEIKRVQAELLALEKQARARREQGRALGALLLMSVVCLSCASCLSSEAPDKAIDSAAETTAVRETEPQNTTLPAETTANPETTVPETTAPETTVPEMTVPETTVPETTVPVTTAPAELYAVITAEDLSVRTMTDYSHIDSDTIRLGEGEAVSVSITVRKQGISWDDICLLYDATGLSVELEEPSGYDDSTLFKAVVTGLVPGDSELWIMTSHDLETQGEEAAGYQLLIHKLDAENGRIVYITPTGKRYHESADCAGGNAIGTPYADAIALGYTACKKCA